jgi:hypothetical protein
LAATLTARVRRHVLDIDITLEFGWDDAALLWLYANAPATALLAASLNRRIRAA